MPADRFVEPGGYVQWYEPVFEGSKILKRDPSASSNLSEANSTAMKDRTASRCDMDSPPPCSD